MAYNDLGQLAIEYQQHTGAVNTSTSLRTQYTYDLTLTSNVYTLGARPLSVTHPNGRVTYWDYNTTTADSLHNRLSLVRAIRQTNVAGTQYAVYDHNGSGRLAIADYPAPDVRLDYFQGTALTYAGYDRFGRIKDQFWDGYGATADVSRVKHGDDHADNRLWREDVIAANHSIHHDEFYIYDGLHRVKNFDRGNLNGTYTGITGTPAVEQDWTLDALGNWTGLTDKTAGANTLVQTRNHTLANEVTTIGASTGTNWADGVPDLAGNMTTVPNPGNLAAVMTLKYDAWNRVVEVKDSAMTPTVHLQFKYDGLNRRIVKVNVVPNPDVTYDYYYNASWQVLETRKDADPDPLEQFIWHPHYVDALAVRFYDASVGGTQVPQYVAHDANFNVVAVTGATGTVVERYQYSAYGQLRILEPNFTLDGDNLSDIGLSHTYTGREFDLETGLLHYRNRYYHSQLGRFVSRDPISYLGGDPNLYRYVFGQPLNLTDPTGEIAPVVAGAVAIAFFFSQERNAHAPGTDAEVQGAGRLDAEQEIQNGINGATAITGGAGVGAAITRGGAAAGGRAILSEGVDHALEEAGWPLGIPSPGDVGDLARLGKKGTNVPGSCPAPNSGVGKFPKNADDLLPGLPRDAKGHIYPNQNTRIRPEQHPLQPGETYAPRHHGEHYHVEIRIDPNKSFNNKKNVIKVKPPGYKPGDGTGFLPGENFPGM